MLEEKLHVLKPAQAVGRRLLHRHNPDGKGPLFFSFGAINLLCGACRFLLMAGMPRGGALLGDAVLECPNCSALNSGTTPTASDTDVEHAC